MKMTRRSAVAACLALASVMGSVATSAYADAAQLTLDGQRALDKLYASQPKSRIFARHAHAILVFPTIIRGAFVFGAQTGNGVLLSPRRRALGFYNISAASFGLQAGGQAFSSALFFMNDRALSFLHKSGGWAVGTGPTIVVINTGAAIDANSTTLSQDVYAFPFAAKGLMAGININGSKITQINPK